MVQVTFSESMDWSTIDGTNFSLEDAFGNSVSATIAYDEASKTVALAPGATYTARLQQTPLGPRDIAGNMLTFDEIWSFVTTTVTSIWSDSEIPEYQSYPDARPVELGVRFTSDVDGFIIGVRFFKGPDNTGPHVVNLWTPDGKRLASAISMDESQSGWCQVDFAKPVKIRAESIYVASYHAPNGNYAADLYYFAEAGVKNWPLNAPPDGADISNGVYVYSENSSFPTETYRSNNYWVDIVFTGEGLSLPVP